MASGIVEIEGAIYNFRPSDCVLVTGWSELSGNAYYFKPTGEMAVGWFNIGSNCYYASED